MNDYSFGNYICEMRKAAGDSQNELGEKLGVSGKAVSKWENGYAKPKTETLRKLAALWDVSVDELLKRREEKKIPDITKIVITGGPCAGKTTGMSWIQNAFTERGYKVLFIPETATELITGGVSPSTCASNAEYLERLMDADPEKRPIRKDRYCLADGNQYFEIDVYPFWQDKAILEIELTDPGEGIRFPKELKIIREVTDDLAYKNSSLAKI